MSKPEASSKPKLLTAGGLGAAAVFLLAQLFYRGVKNGSFDGLVPAKDEAKLQERVPSDPNAVVVDFEDYVDALARAKREGVAVSPGDPVTQANAADHAAAAMLRQTEKQNAQVDAGAGQTVRDPALIDQEQVSEVSAPGPTPAELAEENQKPSETKHGEDHARYEALREKHEERLEAHRVRAEEFRARAEARREASRARSQDQALPHGSQASLRIESADASHQAVSPRKAAEFPPAIGPCRPTVEKKILFRLRSAAKAYESKSRGRTARDIQQLIHDSLVKASDLVSPSSGYQLPKDFAQKNHIEQGRWVKRFSSVVLLRERRNARDQADDSEHIRAFTRTFLNAPVEDQQAAVWWSDGRITFESDWARIDGLLQAQERKTTAELIADPLPGLPE